VHFVFRGAAQDLVVRGDFGADEDVLALRRVPGTDLFHASVELAPDARVGYQLVRDLDETLADPSNPATTPSLTLLGPVSLLVMPGAAGPVEPAPVAVGGTRETFTLDVPVSSREGRPWGGPRRVWVHLPPGYEESERRYPVLIVNDGANALEVVGLPALLDALSGKTMEPVIAVFVELQGSYELARAEQDLYRDLLADVIVPAIDSRYRTRASAAARATLGWDEGAYAALLAGLTRPDVFGQTASQSLYHGSSQGQRVLIRLAAAAEELPAVHLDWGEYDSRDPARAQDMPACNRELAAALAERGAKVVTHTARDGDQVALWKARLPALLAGLFPPRE
jgi:enterochelin esterase-like enzyme